MAGIADMLFGGGAQAYAVPQPEVSMADILAGGVSNAAPATSGGSVATAFADSPAPGAVASAGAQANAAAAQEPGILDRARNWATTNPVQAQALMQGFAALASGRTRGSGLQQLGQFSGVVNQTATEQTAANAERDRAQAVSDRNYGLQTQELTDRRTNRAEDNVRADKQLSLQEARDADARKGSALSRQSTEQQIRERDKLSPLRYKEASLKLDELTEKIRSAPDERTMRQYQTERARLELDNYRQFGGANAEAGNRKAGADAMAAEERAAQESLQTDAAARTAEEIAVMSPEERKNYRLGIKPTAAKPAATAAEIAKDLFAKNPDMYRDPKTGAPNYKLLADDVKAVQAGGITPPANDEQAGFDAALAQAKPGATFQYNGRTFRKPK